MTVIRKNAEPTTILPRWEHLPEAAAEALSKLESKLGDFASKLDISYDRERRIVVRFSERLEGETVQRLKAAGVTESGGRIQKFYTFDKIEVILAPYAAAEEATSNASQSASVDTVEKKQKKTTKVALLDNLDVTPPAAKIELERRRLVKLEQKGEAADPFGLFEEATDPGADNPLRIDNTTGRLDIDVCSFNYKDGKSDGPNHTTITALEFSSTAQRYHLANTYDGAPKYELLFNVDRETKNARVWMREYENGQWSEWAGVCDYGPRQ